MARGLLLDICFSLVLVVEKAPIQLKSASAGIRPGRRFEINSSVG
jgi:hypothetical protein